MKLTTVIEMMEAGHAGRMKELKEVLALHGDVDTYRNDMIPVDGDHLDGLLHVEMVTDPEEPAKYPQGYLHLGEW